MRILVTGVSGFIGARLARRLVERGDRVVGLLRASSDRSLIADLLVAGKLEAVEGDVRDPASVERATPGCDVVVHTAGDVSYWSRDRERQHAINVDGTRNVIAAARKAGVTRFLHTSSVAAVGIPDRGDPPAREDSPWNAGSSGIGYFTTKRAAEELVMDAARRGFPAVIVNPAYVIGPGDVRLHDGNVFIDLHRGTIPMCPPGGNCWVDVDDVIEGILLALEHGQTGERYILGGENLKYREVFELIAGALGVRAPRFELSSVVAKVSAPAYELIGALLGRYPRMTRETALLFQRDLYFDCSKAREELGYAHRPFAETVQRTIEWYRVHGYLPAAEESGAPRTC